MAVFDKVILNINGLSWSDPECRNCKPDVPFLGAAKSVAPLLLSENCQMRGLVSASGSARFFDGGTCKSVLRPGLGRLYKPGSGIFEILVIA